MVHKNSMIAIKDIRKSGRAELRKKAITRIFSNGGEYTDRDVLHILFPSSDNMNNVRPRITELICDGILENTYDMRDNITGRPVRVCRIKDLKSEV